MIVYHGTNNIKLTLDKLDSRYSSNNSFGPGVYFTKHLDTAKEYGSNIIKVNIDESRLVDGMKYKYRDIQKYREQGYIGALIRITDLVINVVIWNIKDLNGYKEDKQYSKWLDKWLRDNKW
jgi:hypothetical protein